jgi:hypothetical protein
MGRHFAPSLVLFFVLAGASPALGQAAVAGRIKMVAGEAFIVRQNVASPAQAGQPVYEADTVRTGAGGRVALTLKDETRLAIGPNSEVNLQKFEFAPGEKRMGLAVRIARGLLAYVSGRIARLSPESVRLETPSALVGVRGTRLAIRVDAP